MIQERKRTFPLYAYNSKKKEEEEEKNFKIFLRRMKNSKLKKKKKKNSSMRGEELENLERKNFTQTLLFKTSKQYFSLTPKPLIYSKMCNNSPKPAFLSS